MHSPGRPRVLLVGKAWPDRGGIPTFLQSVLRSDMATEHGAELLNLAHEGRHEGGRLSLGNLGRTARDAARVWRASGRFDVVHVHSALAPAPTVVRAGLLALAARLRGRPVVVHGHGGRIPLWLTGGRRRALARVALAPASRVVAVSSGGRDALARVAPGRVVLVDNGVDTDVFAPCPREAATGPPRVLYVGLLTPRKGVNDLFEASTAVRDHGLDHELVLVGGAPDEGPEAEREVRAAAPSHARFLGAVDHAAMPGVYADADVFCLPSWWEAAPLSVLEAMASAVPVVATSVGDVPRLAPDGEAALLVPPRRPAALAGAIERLLADRPLAEGLSHAARRRAVDAFSLRAMNDTLASLYAEVAAAG